MFLAQNIVLVGGTGTDKTHAATAIGVQTIEHHRRKVRFFSRNWASARAEKSKGQGRIAEALVRLDLLILDELGYLLFSTSGEALLMHLQNKLYERTNVALSTNLSVSELATVFGDAKMTTALLDCLIQLLPHPRNGNHSFRLKASSRCSSSEERRKGQFHDQSRIGKLYPTWLTSF